MTESEARQRSYDAVVDAMKDLDPQDRLAVLTASAGAVIWACYGENERPKLLRQFDSGLRKTVASMDKMKQQIMQGDESGKG